MIRYNEIAFTAYAVTDLARSRKFYEEVLGLKPTSLKEGVPWVEDAVGNATLGIGVSEQWKPSRDGASVALEVDDYERAVGDLMEKAVPLVMDTLEPPVCHMAVIQDPDGNSIFIHKRHPTLRLSLQTSPPPSSL